MKPERNTENANTTPISDKASSAHGSTAIHGSQTLEQSLPHLGPVLTTLLRCALSLAIQLLQQNWSQVHFWTIRVQQPVLISFVDFSRTYETHICSYLDNNPLRYNTPGTACYRYDSPMDCRW